jgi:hypothetical protein
LKKYTDVIRTIALTHYNKLNNLHNLEATQYLLATKPSLNEYNNLKAVNSHIMIPVPEMWHQRSLTEVLAHEISHMIQYFRLITSTSGTIDMEPDIYHRIDDMI